MPKKFIEHQVIIPHKYVKKFFSEFYSLFNNYSPSVTLGHLKIFNGEGKYLQFNGKGLGLTLHFIINEKFEKILQKIFKFKLKNILVNLIYTKTH